MGKSVDVSGIPTGIVRVEGYHYDHQTITTTALYLGNIAYRHFTFNLHPGRCLRCAQKTIFIINFIIGFFCVKSSVLCWVGTPISQCELGTAIKAL